MLFFKESIIFFGIVLPVILAAALSGGIHTLKSRMQDSFDSKIGQYKTYEQSRNGVLALEGEIGNKRRAVEAWESILTENTPGAITQHLSDIEKQLPSRQFQKTGQEHPESGGLIADASAQGSSQVKLSFRAGYSVMQKALLELETRMPQLQLQNLSVTPAPQAQNLLFDLSYTSWER